MPLAFVFISVFIVFFKTPILVESVPAMCVFLSYEQQASVPKSFAYLFPLRDEESRLVHNAYKQF